MNLYKQRADINAYDEFEVVQGPSSSTQERVQQNFGGESAGGTAYVVANPFVSREAGDAFHTIYEPWLIAFDEEFWTVLPQQTTESAIQAHREYPSKRLIVHYMRLYHPFVTAPTLQFHGWYIDGFEEWPGNQDETGLKQVVERGRPHTPWHALYMGLV